MTNQPGPQLSGAGSLKKPSKYKNKKTVVDGITFDSKKEAAYYQRLKFMESQGLIFNLKRQVKFDFPINGNPVRFVDSKRVMQYIADFSYDTAIGERKIVDVKGMRLSDYKIKRALMLAVHNIFVEEV